MRCSSGRWLRRLAASLGLSRREAPAVLDLALRFSEGRLPKAELGELPDKEVIGQLTAVRGIGVWTAQGVLLGVRTG